MNELINQIKNIRASSMSEEDKFTEYCKYMALKPLDNAEVVKLACTFGIETTQKLKRPEMEAQCYITRAKVRLMELASNSCIKEMTELTLAPNWFRFALESKRKRYLELDTTVKKTWSEVQADIDKCFEAINKYPVAGAVAFCYKSSGEVYGSYYLQLRIYCFKSGNPLASKWANFYPCRWLGFDDLFIISKENRKRLRSIRKDCLSSLYKAVTIFKKQKNYDYLADAFLALSTEHEGFNNPIRARLYLYQAERLIKNHAIKSLEENLAVVKRITKRPKSIRSNS